MAAKILPPQEQLLKRLEYRPDTGELLWLPRAESEFEGLAYAPARHAKSWNTKNAGRPALASLMSNGYRHGMFDCVDFLQHRVIWKLWHGTEPDFIDHINGQRSDNRIGNLRSLTYTMNMRNRRISSNNTSGCPGVYFDAKAQRWAVQIEVDGEVRYIGRWRDKGDAIAARVSATAGLGFTNRHLNLPA